MNLWEVQQLAIALGLGLLVGFQREWTAPHVAGIRTFGLITVFGTITGLFVETTGAWLISAGLLAVAAMIIVGNVMRVVGAETEDEPGLTTEVAALVMYGAGVRSRWTEPCWRSSLAAAQRSCCIGRGHCTTSSTRLARRMSGQSSSSF